MSTDFFSSLSGSFDYVSSMSNVISDYSSIKNGSYSTLMKSYVNKVGNKAALQAYKETGSTTTGVESTTSSSVTKKTTASKSSFLDSHLSEVRNSGSYESRKTKKTEADSTSSSATASTSTSTTTTDKYEKYKSSWLDNQLKQYDKDATATTAADTSVAYDTTI
ncbi:MAG: hypothetical protein II842_20120 [Butyrivibrio sp.]|nr:hypothetical protein [Butyrivibrio sp.]